MQIIEPALFNFNEFNSLEVTITSCKTHGGVELDWAPSGNATKHLKRERFEPDEPIRCGSADICRRWWQMRKLCLGLGIVRSWGYVGLSGDASGLHNGQRRARS